MRERERVRESQRDRERESHREIVTESQRVRMSEWFGEHLLHPTLCIKTLCFAFDQMSSWSSAVGYGWSGSYGSWCGRWKSNGETRRIKKKKIPKTPTILRLRSGTAKGNKLRGEHVAQNSKAWGQHGASSSVHKESQKDTGADMVTSPPSIATHIP